MKKVLYIFRQKSLDNVLGEDKSAPTDFLFGMDKISDTNLDISFINVPRGDRKKLVSKLSYLIERPFGLITKIGLPIEIFPLFKDKIKNKDILICVNDPISLGILFWKKLGFIKADCIVIIQSLPERIKYFQKFPPISLFISALLKKASVILTLSKHVINDFSKDYNIDKSKIKYFYFGVDTKFWSPGDQSSEEKFILSIGNDMNRDYETLIKALPKNIKLKIITSRKIKIESENVEILTNLSNEDVREQYRKSLFVVIPSIRLDKESSGLSSSLQAMSCGKSIIISRIPTLEEIFKDGQHCLFYTAGNQDDLNKKITTLLNDESLREKLTDNNIKNIKNFDTKKMAEQMVDVINNIK